MSVSVSGALLDGSGAPMSESEIYLTSLVNTSEVVVESVAKIITGPNGEYSFTAQTGKYSVHIKQKRSPKYCVGEIIIYDNSRPGTLNDFLTALSEDDLKPDVVRRFEEMVAQAQQSAEAAARSEQIAKGHADNAAGSAQASGTACDESVDAAESARRYHNAASSAATSAE
ncbi:prophage tail fiber N-terminal domain-containing protein, partial [Salmonella enterica]|nr:prophage tail fiber N-terminal domain-containing protein [Salmonella enterica]